MSLLTDNGAWTIPPTGALLNIPTALYQWAFNYIGFGLVYTNDSNPGGAGWTPVPNYVTPMVFLTNSAPRFLGVDDYGIGWFYFGGCKALIQYLFCPPFHLTVGGSNYNEQTVTVDGQTFLTIDIKDGINTPGSTLNGNGTPTIPHPGYPVIAAIEIGGGGSSENMPVGSGQWYPIWAGDVMSFGTNQLPAAGYTVPMMPDGNLTLG